uniref:Uncharacterized protein n=1 Tax=Phytophthora ramorum TaxID=164328 RepID=H3GQZ2_PHYRM
MAVAYFESWSELQVYADDLQAFPTQGLSELTALRRKFEDQKYVCDAGVAQAGKVQAAVAKCHLASGAASGCTLSVGPSVADGGDVTVSSGWSAGSAAGDIVLAGGSSLAASSSTGAVAGAVRLQGGSSAGDDAGGVVSVLGGSGFVQGGSVAVLSGSGSDASAMSGNVSAANGSVGVSSGASTGSVSGSVTLGTGNSSSTTSVSVRVGSSGTSSVSGSVALSSGTGAVSGSVTVFSALVVGPSKSGEVSSAGGGSVPVSSREDGVASLSSGGRRSAVGGTVDFVSGASTTSSVGGGSVSVRGGSLAASAGVGGAVALSGGASSTGAAAGGDISLVGGASGAGVGGGVDTSSGAGLLGSGGDVRVASSASASGAALSGCATIGSGASVDAASGWRLCFPGLRIQPAAAGGLSVKSGASVLVSSGAFRFRGPVLLAVFACVRVSAVRLAIEQAVISVAGSGSGGSLSLMQDDSMNVGSDVELRGQLVCGVECEYRRKKKEMLNTFKAQRKAAQDATGSNDEKIESKQQYVPLQLPSARKMIKLRL